MAHYAITRERNLRGMGFTYSFLPRQLRGMGFTYSFLPRGRGLRGLGQTTDIDVVTGLPCDDPRANCGPLIPTTTIPAPVTLTPPAPIIIPPIPVPPPMTTAPPPAPPTLNLPLPVTGPMPTFVFPSGGSTALTLAPPPPASWFDQMSVLGFPNKYLAMGAILLGIAAAAGGQGRRR